MIVEGAIAFPKTVAEAKKLIGKKITYLRSCDIDRTGRGYYYLREGTVLSVIGKNILLDSSWESLSRLVEYTEKRMTPQIDTVVFNVKTKTFVDFRYRKNGEIELNSTDTRDNDIDCIVTTWANIYGKNIKK